MHPRGLPILVLHIPLYMLAVGFLWTTVLGYISSYVATTVTSLCHMPMLGYMCDLASWMPDTQEARAVQALDMEFEGLHQLLQATSRTSPGLSHELINARIAVEDLIIVVKSGALGCREELVDQLKLFSVEAKGTAREL
ncbi:hypothetical protein DENSPDRAFT_846371, partial [Dentipellis sp. KUC8613]